MKTQNEPVLLLSDARGIYIPQNFAEKFDMSLWGISQGDAAILLQGPDAENYWETWDDVTQHAKFEAKSVVYTLWQSEGGLYAMPIDFDLEENGWL